MKKLLFVFVIFFAFFLFGKDSLAIYDPLTVANNKVGIHIFEPNEIDKVPDLVNNNGGSWGYVTIPLRSDDRNREKWNEFMHKCLEKKIIPIIRLSTTMSDSGWTIPGKFDAIDFANFLNDLDWPTQNRYIIVYNEPNQASEWGGTINPEDYANEAYQTIVIFKERNPDFFIMMAGLDVAAPNGSKTMNWKYFLTRMNNRNPEILKMIDGWSSHSYPNPAFSRPVYDKHDHSIISFVHESNYVKNLTGRDLPVFITETGWINQYLSDNTIADYLKIAFEQIWTDSRIVAITPFVLEAQAGPFASFSFLGKEGPKPQYNVIKNLVKISGNPKIADNSENSGFEKILGAETEFEKVEDSPKEFFDINKILNIFDVFK